VKKWTEIEKREVYQNLKDLIKGVHIAE
jgi:hypothetical protein